ncbi:MAG TPA: response regulator [Steroidobacteraceae bacterium]|jgi:CheY-like chemotaxis protein
MTRTNRILVADDDDPLRQATRDILEEEGYEVTVARDGDELLRTYLSQPFDLVLCDLFMPGKDGLQVIAELRKAFPQTKIVAMSGGAYNGTLDLLHTAQLLGAKEVLAKPFGSSKLVEVVRRVLAG